LTSLFGLVKNYTKGLENVVKHKLEPINEITEGLDSAWGMKGSWEIGMQMPIPAVAGIKASDRFQSENNKYEQPGTRGDEK